MSDAKQLRLGAVFYDQIELLDMYGPLEMFGWVGPQLSIVTVAEEAGPVRSSHGPTALVDYSFDDCPHLDLILVPGGIGTFAELENEKLLAFLRERSAEALITMSVCTGSALLAKAGILDGRRATSNKQMFYLAQDQSDAVEWVESARWVDDGEVATSSGVSAGIDMALAIIERLFSAADAERIAALTEYTRNDDPADDPFVGNLNDLMPPDHARSA